MNKLREVTTKLYGYYRLYEIREGEKQMQNTKWNCTLNINEDGTLPQTPKHVSKIIVSHFIIFLFLLSHLLSTCL